MNVYDVAAFTSLALTPATVLLSTEVVLVWSKAARQSLRLLRRSPRSMKETDWFVLGVTIAFIGSIVDNMWWGIAWGTKYGVGSASGLDNWWFRHGTFCNILFRQSTTIIAAAFHLLAGAIPWRRSIALNLMATAILVAVLVAAHP